MTCRADSLTDYKPGLDGLRNKSFQWIGYMGGFGLIHGELGRVFPFGTNCTDITLIGGFVPVRRHQ